MEKIEPKIELPISEDHARAVAELARLQGVDEGEAVLRAIELALQVYENRAVGGALWLERDDRMIELDLDRPA